MKKCGNCEYWVSRQLGRANAKGDCFRYPIVEKPTEEHWCGEHKSLVQETSSGLAERHKLMSELKAKGVKLNMTWTVKDLKAKLEELNEQDKKAEVSDGQGEEEESG